MAIPRKNAYVSLAVGIALLALILFLLIMSYAKLRTAQTREQTKNDAGKLQVLVAVAPCAYLVERVGGDAVDVAVLTPEGKSPEIFAPSPSQLANFAATRVFFVTGTPVESRFVDNIKSIAPKALVVDLREGVETLADEHRHEDGDADSGDDAIDPHLWTSVSIAIGIAQTARDVLSQIDPANATLYAANAQTLVDELNALERETADALAPYKGRFFVVFHPAYGYYAREFGLSQRAIETDGKAPRPRELEALVADAKDENVRAIIVQPEFNRSAAQVVADALGAKLIEHSPLERDYFRNVRSLTDAILESFGDDSASANE